MPNPEPLQPALDRFKADWEARVGETIAADIAGDIDALRASGILDRAARLGDRWPVASLTDARGRRVDLAALVAAQPVVVTFHRGGWRPFCNLELHAFQQRCPTTRRPGPPSWPSRRSSPIMR